MKLIKFWVFSGNDIKNVFLINYKFIISFYSTKSIIHFEKLVLGIKKVLPLFNSLMNNLSNILLVGSNSIYSQTIYLEKAYHITTKLLSTKVGTLTNFSLSGFCLYKYLELNYKPISIIFFAGQNNIFLLRESKNKKIPTVGVIVDNLNSSLIDYPIYLNSLYFYNIYIITKFFFRYLSFLI